MKKGRRRDFIVSEDRDGEGCFWSEVRDGVEGLRREAMCWDVGPYV